MRIIKEIPHPSMKISVFHMNQKYIVKFEIPNLEQTYKFSEFDYTIGSVEELEKVILEQFCGKVEQIFSTMQEQMNLSADFF
jgi:hypothetical protein